MSIAFDGDGHVRTTLGLYYLGGLTDDEQTAVERHLASCESCLTEYDDAGELVLYLRTLGKDDAEISGEDSAAPVRRANGASRSTPATQRVPLL